MKETPAPSPALLGVKAKAKAKATATPGAACHAKLAPHVEGRAASLDVQRASANGATQETNLSPLKSGSGEKICQEQSNRRATIKPPTLAAPRMKDHAKELARAARYRERQKRNNPAGYAKRMRAAAKRYAASEQGIRARLGREERARRLKKTKQVDRRDGQSIITAATLRRPRFRWIDAHGRVHTEHWQTPEQQLEQLRKEGRL
jgi:hypothetical protein